MPSIDPSTNVGKENYKLLIGSIIPRPIAFVTTVSEQGTLNGAPFSYFSIVSSDPPRISLAVQRSGNQQKDTARNSINKKEFVVHIVDEQNVEMVNRTAAQLPPDQSEIELAGLTPVNSEMISVPGVKEAKIRMECRLEQAISFESSDLLIGRVVKFHIDNDIYSDGKIDPRALAAVSRLAGQDYAKIGGIFTLERPQ
ncbi:flavin reductase family protein [Bacillus lacus]|uniref:Flavin reductase family protein n=1 Tax=Metabacillus lacus TaxID=1983721 RepID=A0A7X2IYS2_9BACI|nr:flavin reductase family protein [Metabacillus lacus]MRX72119.1 flavin reductase family protein [Metabacillus lacus]